MKSGLINQGNQCFINASIQCLTVSPFIKSFLSKYSNEDDQLFKCISKYNLGQIEMENISEYIEKLLFNKSDISESDKKYLLKLQKNAFDIYIYIAFRNIIKIINKKSIKYIDCNIFLSVCKKITAKTGFEHLFSGEQNDPHEFLAFILDKLHNAKSSKVSIEIPNIEQIDDIYYKKYLTHFKSRYENDFSLFVKNLYYYVINIVECAKCKHQSVDVCPSDIMCVSLPENWHSIEEFTLDDCIKEMFKVENIEYKCENCGNREGNRIEKKLLTKPKTLIIKLKRYAVIGSTRLVKVNKMIRYPELLDISKYFCGSDIKPYKLYSIINHIGSMNGGHYYSYVKDSSVSDSTECDSASGMDDTEIWFNCNDTMVNEINLNEVMNSRNAYILFYHSDN
jgi:ubiquitin C-terminal hydrolase